MYTSIYFWPVHQNRCSKTYRFLFFCLHHNVVSWIFIVKGGIQMFFFSAWSFFKIGRCIWLLTFHTPPVTQFHSLHLITQLLCVHPIITVAEEIYSEKQFGFKCSISLVWCFFQATLKWKLSLPTNSLPGPKCLECQIRWCWSILTCKTKIYTRKCLNAGTHFVSIPLDIVCLLKILDFCTLNSISECTGSRPLMHLYISWQLVGHFIADLIQVWIVSDTPTSYSYVPVVYSDTFKVLSAAFKSLVKKKKKEKN